jgi:hypothetical protein
MVEILCIGESQGKVKQKEGTGGYKWEQSLAAPVSLNDENQGEICSVATNATLWMAQQLSTLGLHETGNDKLLKTKRQPRAACIKANSTTDRVHQFLLKNPARWYRLSQIAVGTGCRDKTVSWALHQLKAQGLVEAVTLSRQANSRYLRYCITRESTLT